MANPDHLGEYSKLYYQTSDFDTTQTDALILGDASWVELCAVDVGITRARTLREVVDRCVGDEKEYTGGKRDTGITVNLNELRLSDTAVRAWQQLSDNSSIVALLVLNDDRTEAAAWGLVGNFLIEQDDDTQPSEGNNTNALTFKPAARSAYSPRVKRVYGSGIA